MCILGKAKTLSEFRYSNFPVILGRFFVFLALSFFYLLVLCGSVHAFSARLEVKFDNFKVISGEYNYSALYDDHITFYVVKETFLLASRDDLVDMNQLTFEQERKKIDFTNILQVTIREKVENKEVKDRNEMRDKNEIKDKLHEIGKGNCTDSFSVYFPLGKHVLTKDQRSRLEKFLDNLRERDPLYREREYEVLGWGCVLGGPVVNKKLSEKRAKEVYHFLKDKGIQNVKAEGRGISKENKVLCLNRRADIVVKGIPCRGDK
ncbi:MAG: hypothetical protein QW607_02790 [Desulfurococcaceae archaeon]